MTKQKSIPNAADLTPEELDKALMERLNDAINKGELFNIKVNLPPDEYWERESSGEGVFVLVAPDVKAAYDKDESGTMYEGILNNDSFYYPGLKHGVTVPILMRGEYRPIVPLKWLTEHYGEADKAQYICGNETDN